MSPDALAIALEYFAGLTVPQRAAELLETIATAIVRAPASWAPQMNHLLELQIPMPAKHWSDLSERQRADHARLELLLAEAFQALVLARMLIRRETMGPQGGTIVSYANSPDGRAALERGDAAEVVARRLPD